ncbi:MAG TPA: hypothetical protein VFE23_07460 [Usitatibacter sp.]|jgi:hypothetical protein|nr:hypothetical protein [Usitatibacter sp.]
MSLHRLLLLLVPAGGLAACNSLPAPVSTSEQAERLAAVQRGESEDQVRADVGRAYTVAGPDAAGNRVWIYDTYDPWGEHAEYDVSFDPQGDVTGVTSLRGK